MVEVIERTQKESLQFENIRFHKPSMGEIQADSKNDLSLQEGTKTQFNDADIVRVKRKHLVSGTYAYKSLGNGCRTCFFCGGYGHFVAYCPYSSGYMHTDATANAYSSTFPTRRGKRQLSMKMAMTATTTNYGLEESL